MRVLQLIDSLRPGGAERMAVSYANALARRGQESYLCCTRMEGLLKKKLEPGVGYFFLEKRSALDHRAFIKLKNFVKNHRIQIIQAHSSSYFLAVLVKWAVPEVKVIWHDHYGRALEERRDVTLQFFSRYFDGIISVNEALKAWAEAHLKARKVVYLKNFLPDSQSEEPGMTGSDIKLKGDHSIKIICVANLRPQKDHFTLIRAFELVLQEYPDVSLHLVGKDEGNDYSRKLKSMIEELELQENVFLYGEQEDVEDLVKQATIGVLSSFSEGLPVALLEYGLAGIPVVSTAVGEIPKVVGPFGRLVKSGDPKALAEGIMFFFDVDQKISKDIFLFKKKIMEEYSEGKVIPQSLNFFNSVMN